MNGLRNIKTPAAEPQNCRDDPSFVTTSPSRFFLLWPRSQSFFKDWHRPHAMCLGFQVLAKHSGVPWIAMDGCASLYSWRLRRALRSPKPSQVPWFINIVNPIGFTNQARWLHLEKSRNTKVTQSFLPFLHDTRVSLKTRRRMARERRGAGSSLVSMETQFYKQYMKDVL